MQSAEKNRKKKTLTNKFAHNKNKTTLSTKKGVAWSRGLFFALSNPIAHCEESPEKLEVKRNVRDKHLPASYIIFAIHFLFLHLQLNKLLPEGGVRDHYLCMGHAQLDRCGAATALASFHSPTFAFAHATFMSLSCFFTFLCVCVSSVWRPAAPTSTGMCPAIHAVAQLASPQRSSRLTATESS